MSIHLRRGFTLIELLVVISIIALLIAMLLPALKAARTAAQMSASLSNLRQITIAHHMYAGDSDGNIVFQRYDADGSNTPYWPAVFVSKGYVSDHRIFWSPGRDISKLDLDGSDNAFYFSEGNPWTFPGYGVNTWLTPREEVALVDGTQPGANLNHTRLPPHDKFLLMAEVWTGSLSTGIAGWWVAKAKNGIQPTDDPRIFTYNGGAARSYLDGHASGSDGLDGTWHAQGQYLGYWVPRWTSDLERAPWFRNWWLK